MFNFVVCDREVLEGLYALWVDNFSKIVSHRSSTLLREAWSDCLWTGAAVVKFEPRDGLIISALLQYDDEGALIHAMPDNILEHLDTCAARFNAVLFGGKTKLLKTALCTLYNVNTNPIKPYFGEQNVDVQAYLDRHDDGLGNLYPDKLMKVNIGSNVGLLTVLRDFCKERLLHVHGMQTKYHILNCDVNIYTRTLRVRFFSHTSMRFIFFSIRE